MAVRAAGVRLEMQNLAAYLNGGRQVDDANKKIKSSLDSFAEAERRATTAVRGAMQQRVAAARAESQERIAVARATSARVIEEERRATATLRSELTQRAAAQRQAAQQQSAPTAGGGGLGFLGGAAKTGLGIGLGLLGVQGLQQTLGTVVELDQLQGQARRTEIALTSLAGGGVQASAAIRQIQSVAPGASSELEAAGAATTLLTQKLNSSAVSLGEIARATSIIPQVSSSIRDQSDAIGQLTLFGNSASFARADQLAVRASDVQARVKELAATYPELDDAQLKVAATVQLINERFDALGDAAGANVTGVQSLSSAFADLKQTIATGTLGQGVDEFFKRIADGIREINLSSGGGTIQDQFILLDRLIQGQNAPLSPEARRFGATEKPQSEINALQGFRDQAEETLLVLERGGSAAEPFVAQLREQIEAVRDASGATQADIDALRQLETAYRSTTLTAADFTQVASESTQKFLDEQAKIRELTEARTQIDELTKSSLDLFAQGAPGAGELSSALIELQTHLAGSTQLSEEDAAAVAEAAAQHQLLTAAAGGSVGALSAAEQAKLNDSVAAYQAARANQTLAASIAAIAQAQAGVARGIVGDLSGLIGSGLINAGQAGALNTAINTKTQAGFAGIQAQGLTGPALSFATAQLQREITEPFRQLQQIEIDMTREAQEQHRSAQGASREWNKAQKDAEKAAKATAKALESVEGLFSPSKVTQQQLDIAEAGGAVNLPDDFLRRFRDVSENFEKNGFRDDFGQQQLDEARAALQRIGIQPLEDLKGVFAQFEEAWSNLSLFSSEENLALINQQAVQDQLRLQEQMEQGRKNIYKLFGVAIDDATEAVSGGGGGIPPIDQEALQKKIEDAQKAFIDKLLMDLGVGPGGTSDAALASVVTGVGGGDAARGGLGGLQQSFDNTATTSDILRGTFEGVTTTADILREAFGRVGDSTDAYVAKQDAIPQLVWQGEGGVIDTFPNWKGEEGVIPEFPGWDAWLGPEKVDTGPADIGASGTTGSNTVPSGSDVIRESMTQPSSSTTNNTKTTTVTISSTQSTGSLVADWSILQAQGAV